MPNANNSSVVIANNDIVYLWWAYPEKIENCLGFSIHRIVNGKEEKKALPATVGFDKVLDKRKSPQTTDEWPTQSFNWKDLYAPHDKKVSYRIIPMLGDWKKLTPDLHNSIVTNEVTRTQKYGKSVKVIFNRGLLSTQAFSKSSTDGVKKDDAATMISDPTNLWRKRLGGQMLYNVSEFFKRAKNEGGNYYAALYELTDTELIDHLTENAGTELILSNANGSETKTVDGVKKIITVDDKTNKKIRAAFHKKMKKGEINIYDRMLGGHIGHNKFVVYVDANKKPKAVLTGSTNWTATGLCGQTNNMVIIENDKIAAKYLEYWQQLKKDKKQDAALRTWCADNCFTGTCDDSDIKVWFSPNTEKKSKPAKDPGRPVDVEDVFKFIDKAKKSILFLVFNPGSPSIINHIQEVAAARPKNKPLFIRGAISDAAIAKEVTTEIYTTAKVSKPDKYKVGDQRITGVAAIPGKFSYWEKELLKLGFATIHDKILVIDPFGDNPVVITGSHNLGYKASYTNDENMLVIQNNPVIAKAYAAHVLDVVNHFKWRYKLQSMIGKEKNEEKQRKILEKAWHDLSEKADWMNYYYDNNGFKQPDKLLLP